MNGWLNRFFGIKQAGSSVKTEICAGFISFFTMAYILAVNPAILGDAGMDKNAVLTATCLASFIGTVIMGLYANLPYVLSACMGLNAFFAYTVVGTMGYSWQMALFAVFVEGVIFIILTITDIREKIFNSIPLPLKSAITIGIGLFIAFIGLQKAGICVKNDATLVSIVNITEKFNQNGICAVLAFLCTLLLFILHARKIKGGIIIAIFAVWFAGMICQSAGLYVPEPDRGFLSLYPDFSYNNFFNLGETFGQAFSIDFSAGKIIDISVVVFTFLFVDVFDTIGTLIGLSMHAKMLDENGRLPRIKQAMTSDSIATCAGAILGTSTVTTTVESSAGISSGGRTGLTAVTAGLLFLLAIVIGPIFVAIPAFATAPALIYVGFLMFSDIFDIKKSADIRDLACIFLCIMAIPLFYNVAEGISWGVIGYVVIGIFTGKIKDTSPFLMFLAVLFILKYIFL